MTKPTFDIRIKGLVNFIEDRATYPSIIDTTKYTYRVFSSTKTKFAQSITFPVSGRVKSFKVYVSKYPSGTGYLQGYITDSNHANAKQYNPVYVVNDLELKLVPTQPIIFDDPSGGVPFEFDADEQIFLEVWWVSFSTGGVHIGIYDTEYGEYVDLYQDESLWWWNGSTWVTHTGLSEGSDIAFEMVIELDADEDITDYVKRISTDTGKNELGGEYQQGRCSMTLRNPNGLFYPQNSNSDLYRIFQLHSPIEAKATYNGIDYPIFKGRISVIEPPIDVDDPDVFVDIADKFEDFDKEKVSPGVLSSKTADELIEEIFTELDLDSSEYSLDSDNQILASVDWDEQNVLELLKMIVEVGQHYHFVGTDGIYYFKNNQWPASLPVSFTIDLDDPCCILDKFKVKEEKKNLVNRSRIHYSPFGDSDWDTQEDGSSIMAYGQRDYEMDNDLMPNQAYAEAIGELINSNRKKPLNGFDCDFKSIFPDVLLVNLGSVMDISHSLSGLDGKFVVDKLVKEYDKSGIVRASALCSRLTLPPVIDLAYEYEYMTQKDPVNTHQDKLIQGQTFKVTSTGDLIKMTVGADLRVDETGPTADYFFLYLTIYNTSGGLPTGSGIAFSTGKLVRPTEFLHQKEFTFTVSPIPTLAAGTVYAWALQVYLLGNQSLNTFQPWGSISNPYADGQALYKSGATWYGVSANDLWAKLYIG